MSTLWSGAGEPRTLPGNHCVVHRYHWPPVQRTVRHHVWPLGMGGPDTAANLVNVCDTGHYSIHGALDALMRGEPPKGTREERRQAGIGFDRIRRNAM